MDSEEFERILRKKEVGMEGRDYILGTSIMKIPQFLW